MYVFSLLLCGQAGLPKQLETQLLSFKKGSSLSHLLNTSLSKRHLKCFKWSILLGPFALSSLSHYTLCWR